MTDYLKPQSPAQRQDAFALPQASQVLAAIKPRHVYRRGPDLFIPSRSANQALTDKHRALRLTRI